MSISASAVNMADNNIVLESAAKSAVYTVVIQVTFSVHIHCAISHRSD